MNRKGQHVSGLAVSIDNLHPSAAERRLFRNAKVAEPRPDFVSIRAVQEQPCTKHVSRFTAHLAGEPSVRDAMTRNSSVPHAVPIKCLASIPSIVQLAPGSGGADSFTPRSCPLPLSLERDGQPITAIGYLER